MIRVIRTIELTRLASGVERGYLVYAGQLLGIGTDGRDVSAETDVVILALGRITHGWSMTLRVIEVRSALGSPN